MGNSIVITGSPTDGFAIIGPFADSEDALEYAEHNNDDRDWWITDLIDPESEDA